MRRTLIEIVVEVSAARKSLCQRKQSDIKVHQSRVNNLLKLQLFLMKNNSRQTDRRGESTDQTLLRRSVTTRNLNPHQNDHKNRQRGKLQANDRPTNQHS